VVPGLGKDLLMAFGVGEWIVLAILAADAATVFLVVKALVRRRGAGRVPTVAWLLFAVPALFGVSAAVTPPDLISTLILAIPACLLLTVVGGLWYVIVDVRRSARDPHNAPNGPGEP